MFGKLILPLLILTTTIMWVWQPTSQRIDAVDPPSPLLDTDGDFLPDCVEYAALTSAVRPDSDEDSVPDFVEVVQRLGPRMAGVALPLDQEMRIVVTGPRPGSGSDTAWMHLLVRVVGSMQAMSTFESWLDMPWSPGVQFPFDMLSLGPAVFRERNAGEEGLWLMVSVPLASTEVLRTFAPLNIHVRSVIGGRTLHSLVPLIDAAGELATLVPFDQRFAFHSLEPQPGGSSGQPNRVCLFDLSEVSSGAGGTVFEVVHADCEDCNEVECVSTCANSVGWIITVPDGFDGLTGGY
jgi:hypothetical protein